MKIVILGAFQDELTQIYNGFSDLHEIMISKARCLAGKWNGHDIYIGLSGIGTNAAAITTTMLCEKIQPDIIIFCGVAGGLKSDQKVGDLIVANQVVDADLLLLPDLIKNSPYKHALNDPHVLQPITTYYPVHSSLLNLMNALSFERLTQGIVVTSNAFPAPKNLFEEIKSLKCSAIEMESAGIYKAAAYFNVPVLTLRAISNLLDESGHDLGSTHDALKVCSQRLADCLMHVLSSKHHLESIALVHEKNEIQDMIKKHNLAPHPEGGWYRRVYQSNDSVIATAPAIHRYLGEARLAGSAIIYLLPQNEFSAWHSVQSDETWCFHSGATLLLRIIDLEGHLHEVSMGHEAGYLQYTVRAGEVFCAESLGAYSLVSCVVTPGFDFKDFHLLTSAMFLSQYPQYHALARLIQ